MKQYSDFNLLETLEKQDEENKTHVQEKIWNIK